MQVSINIFWLIAIVIISMIIGGGLCFWYLLNTLKKTLGFKSWKQFLNQVKKQQELQKKMQGKGLNEVLKDPDLRKQIEQFRKKFK